MESLEARDALPEPHRAHHRDRLSPPAPGASPSTGRRRTPSTPTVERDHASLVFLAQALSASRSRCVSTVVTSGVHAARQRTTICDPSGRCSTAPAGSSRASSDTCRPCAIDVDQPRPESRDEQLLVDHLLRELAAEPVDERRRVPPRRALGRELRAASGCPRRRRRPGQRRRLPDHRWPRRHRPRDRRAHRHPHQGAPRSSSSAAPPCPTERTWADARWRPTAPTPLRARIEGIQRLKALGAEVIIAGADVTDEAAMADVVRSRERSAPATSPASSTRPASCATP